MKIEIQGKVVFDLQLILLHSYQLTQKYLISL